MATDELNKQDGSQEGAQESVRDEADVGEGSGSEDDSARALDADGESSDEAKAADEAEKGKKDKKARKKKKSKKAKGSVLAAMLSVLLFPATLVYMEVIMHLWSSGADMLDKLPDIIVLAFTAGLFLSAISCVFVHKGRKWFTRIMLFLLAFLFSFHAGYFNIFHTWFAWTTAGQAGEVTAFWREAVMPVIRALYVIVAFFVPFVLHCIFGRRIGGGGRRIAPLALSVVLAVVYSFGSYFMVHDEFGTLDLDQSYVNYGVMGTTGLEVRDILFGSSTDSEDYLRGLGDASGLYQTVSASDTAVSDTDIEYDYNIMDIDFEAAAEGTNSWVLSSMDEYFASLPATQQNEYTGMFEGKNLIMITIESFCSQVIDPDQTPILYQMATEGFVFENYYSSFWGGSTASGEYSNITGNFYTTAQALDLSADTYQPFALGNQFSKLGYTTLAYHNYTGYYYGRTKSHPNFGYVYKGIGSGLEASGDWEYEITDSELAKVSAAEYIGTGEPFHVYYMTMGGHGSYQFSTSYRAKLHKDDLLEKYDSYSSDIRAYLACQYELELMLEYLVEQLDEAGILEDTVFVMTADHYPYLLGNQYLAELYDLDEANIRKNVELYKNSLIIWCADMEEPIVVDTPCSSIDILPTVSNLFGLEYDSRIITGTDILSDTTEHIAIVKTGGWSWVTDQGTYSAYLGKFTKNGSCTMTDEEIEAYIERINAIVKLETTYSPKILEQDYYKHIFSYIS